MNPTCFIRKTKQTDIPALQALFKKTILSVNRRDYSPEECADWASCADDTSRWRELLACSHYIVAENEQAGILGFSSLNDEGYLHSLFVHPDFQRQGVASALYSEIERFARERTIRKITAEVSRTAKAFFERKGFQVDKKQKRKARSLYLTNYKMSKELNSA